MVGLAFEVNESHSYKQSVNKNSEKSHEKRIIEIPVYKDIFHYGFCYLGVLAGDFKL